MNSVDIFGIAAAVLTTSSFLPQAIKTIRYKDTRSLSLPMYIILTTGVLLWLTYGILIRDFALIFANSITGLLALIILTAKIRFDLLSKESRNRLSCFLLF